MDGLCSLLLAERHSEGAQQTPRLVVVVGVGHKGHVHALYEGDLVRIDLRKDALLVQTHAVVAVSVKALGIDAAEVADTRQGHADKPIEKFVHASAAQRHPAAYGVAFA